MNRYKAGTPVSAFIAETALTNGRDVFAFNGTWAYKIFCFIWESKQIAYALLNNGKRIAINNLTFFVRKEN